MMLQLEKYKGKLNRTRMVILALDVKLAVAQTFKASQKAALESYLTG